MTVLTPTFESLAHRVGLSAASPVLLTALTHSSYAAEHQVESNERLEFLGDAVVDLVIADAIIAQYPELNQGTGSLTRSKVVNEASLAQAAHQLGIGDVVRLGRGEIKSGGAQRPSLLADTFEAVVAAIYLERGFDASRDFVLEQLGDALTEAAAAPGDVDPKSKLRQQCEVAGSELPHYEVHGDGPSHDTLFTATVSIGDRIVGRGEGKSKKAAEVAAALNALEESDRA